MPKLSINDFQAEQCNIFYEMAFDFYKYAEPEKEIGLNQLSNTFNNCINKSPYIRGVFICCDEVIAGYALLTFTYSNEYGGLIVFIDELYIKGNYRKSGLASYCISSVISEYTHKAKYIELIVKKENFAAIKLYERFGFSANNYLSMGKGL